VDSTVTASQSRDALLAAIARHDRLIVLTGDARSGKTSLCRSVVADAGVTASWVDARAGLTFHEILQQVAADLQTGARPPATADDLALAAGEHELIALIEHAIDTNSQRSAIVAVDDAHVLSRFVIGKTQTLVNLASSGRGLTVLLAGGPALELAIEKPENHDLKRAITTRLRLRPVVEPEKPSSKPAPPPAARIRVRPRHAVVAVGGLALLVGAAWIAWAIGNRPTPARVPMAVPPTEAPPPPTPQPASQPASQPEPQPAPPVAAEAPPANLPPTAPLAAAPAEQPAAEPFTPVPSTPEQEARLERLHQTMEREAMDLAGRGDVNGLMALRAKTEAAYEQIGVRRPDFLAALIGELDSYLNQARTVRKPDNS
jgi:chloramphenicol 3-O-phosphotransferase